MFKSEPIKQFKLFQRGTNKILQQNDISRVKPTHDIV